MTHPEFFYAACENCDGQGEIHEDGQRGWITCPMCGGTGMVQRKVTKKIETLVKDNGDGTSTVTTRFMIATEAEKEPKSITHNEYCGVPCTTPGHEHLPPTTLINRAEKESD